MANSAITQMIQDSLAGMTPRERESLIASQMAAHAFDAVRGKPVVSATHELVRGIEVSN